MKKIITLFLCAFLLLTTVNVFAEDTLEIVSGTVIGGELDAEISALLRYEFSEEIEEPAYEDITLLPATVGEISAEGNILTIRLASQMTYDTEHILDLSKVVSVNGNRLSDAESKIKFTTKCGEAQKIFEDDFETGVLNTAVWRSATDVIVQKEGDEGNYSRKATGGVNVDNFVGATPVYRLDGDFTAEFDVFFEEDTIDLDYTSFYFAGNNGLKSSDENYKRYETKKLLGYDFETGIFGVLFNTNSTAATVPTAPIAGKVLNDGWNNILVKVNYKNQSMSLYINGELIKDGDGNSEFLIPCAGATGYSPTFDDMPAVNIFHTAVGAKNGGADAEIYYDNIHYSMITSPFFAFSNIAEGEKISVTCPEIELAFRNFPEKVSVEINGTPVSEENIKKNSNNVYCIYPDLEWEKSYSVSGKVYGEFGTEKEFTLNFETEQQPDQLIETVGFFKGGKRIFSLESGEITAKLKMWQKESKSYIILMGLYENVEGRVRMISVSSPVSFTSDGTLSEKEVSVTVPEDNKNYFAELIILKDSLARMPYESIIYSGDHVLR